MASFTPLASAQGATAWSFDQVLQQALQSHPSIAGKRSAQAAARADLDGAQWQRFPSLSAEVPTGSQETGGVVRIEQPLWSGGRIDAGIDAAGSRVDAAGAAIEEERLTLSLRVIAAYSEALRQTARVRSAEEGLAEHQRLLNMIKRRVVQSVSSQTDQRLAESLTYQAANDVSNARQALENALAQLSQLAGKPVRLVRATGIGVGEPLPGASLERIMRQAIAYSPTLHRLEFEAQAADSEITLQCSAYMPKIVLRMEKPTGGMHTDNRTRAMLVLQAQPGAGLSAKAGVDAAVARREGARAAHDVAEREVRERFTLDWNEAEASRQRLDNAGEASTTSTQVFESYARQYVIGRKSWNDVLNAVREATQAQLSLEDTRAQAIAASLRLAAQTGTLAGRARIDTDMMPTGDSVDTSIKHGLLTLSDRAARLTGQHLAAARLADLQRQLEQLDDNAAPGVVLTTVWQAAGLEGAARLLHEPTPGELPFAVYSASSGWGLLQSHGADGAWRGEGIDGRALQLASLAGLACVGLPRRSDKSGARPGALGLVRNALWLKKNVFVDAVLATALVTLLTMATSLFSMQVYDRVIPNQSFSTLWVLVVGVALSIGLEFILKQVRSRIVDHSCNDVDHELSEWFFQRMLGIRMEARPASVGTLAAQVKGFEMVRGVLTSTSLFVLTDVPFALIFLAMITIIGGPLVVVPLVALPLALLCGLMFQRAIQAHTRKNLNASNRKAGLLVEAVDGVETLKGSSAEWMMQARWAELVAESSHAEQNIRDYAALSQNITAAFQQLTNVALISMGAWFVAENQMTMGALMACTIISNRALMPIVQLPAVMVQWAHARASIDGLEQVISLPNEADNGQFALTPRSLDTGLRFERIRFTYGGAQKVALEVESLAIRPGERVGLVGAIGSGKSTLLKLASGLYQPAEGKVYLGDVDMALLAPAVVREMIGYLPQETRLFSGSLRDNLLLGLADPGEEAILAAAKRTGLTELILGQPRGLALAIAEGGRGVSGGQRQLIAVTRLLLAKPRIWLLHEPTGAMDAKTEARIVGLLGELAAEGVTMVATTHKNALLPLLDRLVVLQAGRVLLDGPRDFVLAKLSGKPQAVPSPATAPVAQGAVA